MNLDRKAMAKGVVRDYKAARAAAPPDVEVLTDGDQVVGAAAYTMEGAEALIMGAAAPSVLPESDAWATPCAVCGDPYEQHERSHEFVPPAPDRAGLREAIQFALDYIGWDDYDMPQQHRETFRAALLAEPVPPRVAPCDDEQLSKAVTEVFLDVEREPGETITKDRLTEIVIKHLKPQP